MAEVLLRNQDTTIEHLVELNKSKIKQEVSGAEAWMQDGSEGSGAENKVTFATGSDSYSAKQVQVSSVSRGVACQAMVEMIFCPEIR